MRHVAAGCRSYRGSWSGRCRIDLQSGLMGCGPPTRPAINPSLYVPLSCFAHRQRVAGATRHPRLESLSQRHWGPWGWGIKSVRHPHPTSPIKGEELFGRHFQFFAARAKKRWVTVLSPARRSTHPCMFPSRASHTGNELPVPPAPSHHLQPTNISAPVVHGAKTKRGTKNPPSGHRFIMLSGAALSGIAQGKNH